jgi:hypothetical protein
MRDHRQYAYILVEVAGRAIYACSSITFINSLLWSTMTLSQLDEPLRSKIVNMTAGASHWFVTYQSNANSTANYFSSYEAATSFRGIVEHCMNANDTITWSDARLPDYVHAEPTIRYVCDETVTKVVSYCMMLHAVSFTMCRSCIVFPRSPG